MRNDPTRKELIEALYMLMVMVEDTLTDVQLDLVWRGASIREVLAAVRKPLPKGNHNMLVLDREGLPDRLDRYTCPRCEGTGRLDVFRFCPICGGRSSEGISIKELTDRVEVAENKVYAAETRAAALEARIRELDGSAVKEEAWPR